MTPTDIAAAIAQLPQADRDRVLAFIAALRQQRQGKRQKRAKSLIR